MGREIVQFIRKSNELVEARYKFDIWESRIFTKMLTMIHRTDEDFKDYKIYLKNIVQEFDLDKNREAYELLREGARKLMKKNFYIPYEVNGVKRLFETPVVSSLDSAVADGRRINDEHLYLTVSFHPKMKPYLLQLKSQFTMYDVRNILKLPSAYSIRIYELLKQYEKIGYRVFVVEEMKEILGIEDKYKLYGHFKKRVLEKAQEDLRSQTDIWFDYEEIKKGRAVHRIKFLIYKNAAAQREEEEEETTTPPDKKTAPAFDEALYEEWWEQLKKYDVKSATLQRWISECGDNTYHLRNCIRYVLNRLEKGEKLETVGGYISALLKEESIADPVQQQKEDVNARKQKATLVAQRKTELEHRLKALYGDLLRKEDAMIEVLFAEQPSLRSEILEKLKNNPLAYYDARKSAEENLQNPIFTAAFRNAVRRQFAPRFETLGQRYQAEIKAVKGELASL